MVKLNPRCIRRAQIEDEDAALPSKQKEADKDYDWGIVSIKAQEEECVEPLQSWMNGTLTK